MSRTIFRTDPTRTVGEVIDGEAIVIDIETGSYFSLQGAGAFVWQMLSGYGLSLEDLVTATHLHTATDAAQIEAPLRSFVESLVREGLVVSDLRDTAPPLPEVDAGGAACGFVAPQLSRYDDMQEFLLVDPIHEVDEAGWPHLKPS